ncbi:segregation/condensation protein A [Bacillus badius]|uniref:Segregation and condensation protein A n=1 Tax=Bacillus badius TaxID=1455 RepID=A0ABR5AYY1_BACBA|nr:segregation/condensation protein A [Bacillus badius]KIL75184.1 Segregation and condensation protein A [Bacillus badius]KIL79830.1 Segregation and condensation protein A [Bacillus badius]KZR60282.1 segregation/condensation protein A [Bacillus badius]MED4715089.1 segregation/condensation protein A [Bacillus badius]
MQYNVKTEVFEGPLDLLLHLIQRLEIDIYDIPMTEITEQYLLFIHAMKELELDVASEYLVMAATLLAIKSKTLLPVHEEESAEEVWEEDPREELVGQLVEYRKFKEAAKKLQDKELERGQFFTKAPSDLTAFSSEETAPADLNVTVYDMLGAFHKLLRRKKLKRPYVAKVSRQEIPIEKRMQDILLKLKQTRKLFTFNELFHEGDREVLVVSFLAVLELMKQNEIIVEQQGNFAELFIQAKGEAEDGNR